VVRTYIDIKEMVIIATKIKKVLGDLGETPYDPFREEKDEDAIGDSFTNKQLLVLNETLIHFFRGFGNRNGASASSYGNTSRCQLCQDDDYFTVACPKHNDMWPKCDKCGGRHKAENCGISYSFCNGLVHSEDRYWKNRDMKLYNSTTNYLEVLVNDEETKLT